MKTYRDIVRPFGDNPLTALRSGTLSDEEQRIVLARVRRTEMIAECIILWLPVCAMLAFAVLSIAMGWKF